MLTAKCQPCFSNKHNLTNVYHSNFKILNQEKLEKCNLKWVFLEKKRNKFLILFAKGTFVHETGAI